MCCTVIATDWSGPTAFLDEEVGYPLRIDGLAEITSPGAFQGHKWAEPSLQHLQDLLRQLVQDPAEAQRRGRCASSFVTHAATGEVSNVSSSRCALTMQGSAPAHEGALCSGRGRCAAGVPLPSH
jgi:hypothetical protein